MAMLTPGPAHRAAEQVSREEALGEVSDVVLNLDHTISRAKKARALVRRDEDAHNIDLALADLVKELERVRKRLMHDTYDAGDSLRLL